MRHLWSDVRDGVRMLNGALFKGLPFEDADRLVAVTGTDPSRNAQRLPVGVQDLVTWRARQTVFEASGEWSVTAINLAAE